MLASGADVKIGDKEFMLTTDDDAYLHIKENLFGDLAEIIGAEGKQTSDTNILLWSYDNFIEGDGLRYYDENQPARWHTGNNNPRIPGSIQSPPTRAQTSQSTAITPTFGGFVQVGGTLWYFTGEQGFFSTDNGATWTANADVATELPASYQITAVCSDGEFPYFAASDGSNRGIWRCDSTTVATDVVTAHANTGAYKGITVKDGYLHAWTGGTMFRYALDIIGGVLPLTHSNTKHRKKIFNVETPSGTIYANAASDENTVIMSRAYDGVSQFFEWKRDPQTNALGGNKFWTILDGFTAKVFTLHAGIIWVLGDYQDKVGLWAYSVQSKQPLFMGYVGEANSVNQARWIAPSYGPQLLLGVDDGTTSYIYVYDAEEDAFSQLDERTISADGTMLAGITSRRRRVSAHFATTTTKFNRWNIDSDTPASSWDWDSSAFDFKHPQDEKILLGFHVVMDQTVANSTIRMWYQIEEDGVWVDGGATATTAEPHTYVPISTSLDTVKFRTLRMRAVATNGARLFSVTARAYVNTRRETWKLRLDLRHEPGSSRHPSSRTARASTLRDYIHNLVDAGNIVAFQDGRRYSEKSGTEDDGYTLHSVLLQFPQDAIDSQTEGSCDIILRSVFPSA
jgi:hypothetical protein